MAARAPRCPTPNAYLKQGRPGQTARVVVCAGDSFTQGTMSADYLAVLQARSAGRSDQFVNAGVDGNLAWSVLQRLDDVVACRPDAVTLLVGSNDVLGALDERWRRTYRQQRIPRTPTLDWYVESVDAILARLRSETDAAIAVLDLPMLGEDLGSEPNRLIEEYNAALRGVAAAHDVPCLPLHDRLVALLPSDHHPPVFEARTGAMFSGFFQHLVLRRSWGQIGARRGFAVLIDDVHLAEPAAEAIADLIEEWLEATR